jgi:CubicO group peptidase (beta-lactamase class C family)
MPDAETSRDGRFAMVFALAAVLFAAAVAPGAVRAESAVPQAPTFSRAALDSLGDLIRREIAADKIPGGVLLIQQHGKPVYFENFGVRDVATRLPMTADTIFRIYSMSKPIASVAAMMLVEDRKLSLDDPVSKYIPAFADVKVGVEKRDENGKTVLALEPVNRPITIEDLLRHTSGLTYGFYGDSAVRKLYAQADLFNGDVDNAEFVEHIARLPLADSRERYGITAIRPTCSAALSRWCPDSRCFSSRSSGCSTPSG